MPSAAQVEEARRVMDETLGWFKQCNLEVLRRDDLGEKLSFEPAMADIERVVTFYRKLLDCELSNLPFHTINRISTAGLATIDVLKRIGTFDPEKSGSPFPDRLTLMNEIKDRWEDDFSAVSPVLAYATMHNTTYGALRNVSPLLASRTGLDTSEDSMAVVAAKIAELVAV